MLRHSRGTDSTGPASGSVSGRSVAQRNEPEAKLSIRLSVFIRRLRMRRYRWWWRRAASPHILWGDHIIWEDRFWSFGAYVQDDAEKAK